MKRAWVQRGIIAGIVWCGALAPSAHAATGYVITYDIARGNNAAPSQQMIELAPGHARITAPGQQTIVCDVAQHTIWMLDDTQHTATRMDLKQLSAMMQQAQGTYAQLLGNLGPEEQAQTAQLMQQLGAAPPSATAQPASPVPTQAQPTGRHETISGFPCEAYTVHAGGASHTEWRTTQAPPETLEPAFRQQTMQLESLFRDMMAAIPQSPTLMTTELPLDASDGFVVRQESQGTTVTFRAISKQEFGSTAFTTPAGYREVDMMSGVPQVP